MIDDRTEKHLMLIADLKAENAQLRQENTTLKAEIVRLEEEAEALAAEADENAHANGRPNREHGGAGSANFARGAGQVV